MFQKFVKEASELKEDRLYTVKPTLIFSEEQLNDPQPITLTARQLFNMLVKQEEPTIAKPTPDGVNVQRH